MTWAALPHLTRKSSFLIYNCYRIGIKCPKQAGYHLDHQVKTSPFHLRWLMLILFLLLSPQFRFPWSLSSSFKSYFSIIRGAPFWDVLVLYGHCPNSFRPRPTPLSNEQMWKKVSKVILSFSTSMSFCWSNQVCLSLKSIIEMKGNKSEG